MIDPQRMATDIDELRYQLQDAKTAQQLLQNRLNIVDTQLKQQQQLIVGAPQVQNLIPNSDLGHSWDTFKRNPTVADDARFECYNIYRNTVPVAGQQLLEDSVYSGVLVANSKALPDAGRSDTPTLDPDWDRAKGNARLGTTSTIDFPFPASLLNIFNPGRTLYCGVIAAKRTANVTIPGGLYAGLWNNTAGKRDWLPASNFTLSASVVGTPGATTSRDYRIVAHTDWGRTIESTTVTVAGAPANGNFVSGSVYVDLSWEPLPGVIAYYIYRKTGAVYDLLAIESIANGYFDQGAIRTAGIGGYPSTDDTKAIAYAATQDGILDAIPVDGGTWSLVDFAINIPTTFALADVTDKVWLRVGLTQALTGADAAHGLLLDLFYLSYISGAWAPHPDDDKGAQPPITTGHGQGGTGSGGTGFDPPPDGGGSLRCIAEDSRVIAAGKTVAAQELEPGQCILSPARSSFHVVPVRSVVRSWAEETLIITSESGHKIRCSPTEPFKRHLYDQTGIWANRLKVGDTVIVSDETKEFATKITEIEKADGCWVVMISLVGHRKFFIAAAPGSAPGGFVLHNVKLIDNAF